jgi:hypothetical protein
MRAHAYAAFFRKLPIVTTDRLQLRAISPIHAKGLFELDSDPLVSERAMSRLAHTPEDSRRQIERCQRASWRGYPVPWAVVDRQSGEFLGTCGVTGLDLAGDCATVGYALRQSHWNRGLTTEASTACSSRPRSFESRLCASRTTLARSASWRRWGCDTRGLSGKALCLTGGAGTPSSTPSFAPIGKPRARPLAARFR